MGTNKKHGLGPDPDLREFVAEEIWNELIRIGDIAGVSYTDVSRAVANGQSPSWAGKLRQVRASANAALYILTTVPGGLTPRPAPCLDCGKDREDRKLLYCTACGIYRKKVSES